MDVNKFKIEKTGFVDKQLVIPITLDWDYLGLDQSIDLYEEEVIGQVVGDGRDFEIDRFANAPYTGTPYNTDIQYNFYFYSGGPITNQSSWIMDYRSEGFTTQEVFYYSNNFANSFFKLDLYDTVDDKRQTNYLTIIIPTQQGLKMEAIMAKTPVQIKKPQFVLDYIGDKEGFFIYWLKSRVFLNIDTFYMSAKFYNAKTGSFTKMMNIPQSYLSNTANPYFFDAPQYFYYQVRLKYEDRTYQVFNLNPNQTEYLQYGNRVGTPTAIKWYEYVNPPQ